MPPLSASPLSAEILNAEMRNAETLNAETLRISVVIPAWNAARFLEDAVASVLGQTLPVFEVVVVDDGSTDATAEIADALAARHDVVRVIRQANAGPGGARDRGIAEVSGDLVALLDADDVWMPSKLERQLRMLRSDPSLRVVFTLAENVFDGVEARGPSGPMPAYLPSAMLARRDVVVANGPFASAGMLADWVPWFLRLRDGGGLGVVEELLVHRRVHGDNFTTRNGHARSAYATHVGEALRRRRTT